jgi:hypothetical protein
MANVLLTQGEDVRGCRSVVVLTDSSLLASPWPVRPIRIHGIRRARASTLAHIREVVIIILRVNNSYLCVRLQWPEEHLALARPPHNILLHVGFLLVVNDDTRFSIYEIELGGSAFLHDYGTDFCAPNLHGGISPIWLVSTLPKIIISPDSSCRTPYSSIN